MGRVEVHTEVKRKKLREDPGVDGRIILKWISEK
jgi:hypothetical protein